MPRAILLPRSAWYASTKASATEARITTRARPDGTMKVSRKSVMIRPSKMRG